MVCLVFFVYLLGIPIWFHYQENGAIISHLSFVSVNQSNLLLSYMTSYCGGVLFYFYCDFYHYNM